MLTPVITPEGILTLEGAAESAVERKMTACDGAVPLLRLLAAELHEAELEPPFRWLREWALFRRAWVLEWRRRCWHPRGSRDRR